MNIVDIVLFVIIAVVAIISAKKGFLMTLFNVIAYAVAGVVSRLFCLPVAEYVYDGYFSEKILSKLNTLMPTGSVEGELSTVVSEAVDTLPSYIKALIEHFDVVSFMNEQAVTENVYTVDMIESVYLAPAVTNVLSIVASVALFVLFSFVLRMALTLVNKGLTGKKHKVIRGTNTLFGAAFGVVKGSAIITIIAAIFNIAAPALNKESINELVNGSAICNMVAEIIK